METENLKVMTPEKEAELFGDIMGMIQTDFDHAQFADVEQELILAGHLEQTGYTYEEMWNLLETCGLDMDAILDKVDDYGMGMRETVLCTLDIVVDGNFFVEDKEEEPMVTPNPKPEITPVPEEPQEDTEAKSPEDTGAKEDAGKENIPQEETTGKDAADNTETTVDMAGATERFDDIQNGNPSQDTAQDSELAEDDAEGEPAGVPSDNESSDAAFLDDEEAPESFEPGIEDADALLGDVEDIVNEVLGETGVTEEELIEILEEEVPLVAAPSAEGGPKKGWMLWWFFLLLLIIAILVGRAAYKKLESKAKEADE